MEAGFFLRKPIFSTVISLMILLLGGLAIFALPIEQFPDMVPPQITVAGYYYGATSQVIAETVAAPLEQQINGVEDMIYMRSTSAGSGEFYITVTFAVGTNPDMALVNVNNRVQQGVNSLPEDVRRVGVTTMKRSSSILELLSVSCPDGRYDSIYVSNYALINVLDELKRVPGVGDAQIFGSQDYAMRIWIQPDKMTQLGVTPSDIAQAIGEQNAQFASGRVGDEPNETALELTWLVNTKGRLVTPEEFGNIIIRAEADGSMLRIKDVARVELGAGEYNFVGWMNGSRAVFMAIFLSPGANALDTHERVIAKMNALAERFPSGIRYDVPFDTTEMVRISIQEVVHTLFEAMFLVFLVVYLFLQKWRATLIPCLAVPVSIVGTFFGMQALGFSINTLTLFGLVLAIGIVVDDAIVVMENVERIMEEDKLPVFESTVKAMNEVTGPVIAIVLVLCAVFLPVAFMGGFTGQLYRQFAVTIAVSVVISGIVALTLTPALCVFMLSHKTREPRGFFRWFNNWFTMLTHGYTSVVRVIAHSPLLTFLGFFAVCGLSYLLLSIVPTALMPAEDSGGVMSLTILPDGASIARTAEAMAPIEEAMRADPNIAYFSLLTGYDIMSGTLRSNYASTFILTTPWDKRPNPDQSSFAMVKKMFGLAYNMTDGLLFAFNPPTIVGMSLTGGFEMMLQYRGSGDAVNELQNMSMNIAAQAAQRPELVNVTSTFSAIAPTLFLDLDREKAKALGVPINLVYQTMQCIFGSAYINDFNLYGRSFRVRMQAEASYRERPEDIENVFVRSMQGEMIPLPTIVNVQRVSSPQLIERYNGFPAAYFMGEPAPGYTSGQAMKAMEEIAAKLPQEFTIEWTGTSFQEKSSSSAGYLVFLLSIIMAFLILAALYESWSLPLAVLTAVPFALLGAVAALWFRNMANDVYFQVALVTLIGLSAKNAILIVEFAEMNYKAGMTVFDAAMEAARQRFRPIIMTSLAFIMGCVPLAISTGAGSGGRQSIGTSVVGGMLVASTIAILFVPSFFNIVVSLSHKLFPPKKEENA